MDLKKTPFYQKHIDNGGKVVDFSGWALPLEYKSMLTEAKNTRVYCGLFDASHMGQIRIKGTDAFKFLQNLVTNDLSLINKGKMQYNLFLNGAGTVIDDLMVYNLGDAFFCIVNASNIDKVYAWLKDNQKGNVDIIDESSTTALLSLQGPHSSGIMEQVLGKSLDNLKYMRFIEEKINGRYVLISRSGYTGEDGFEIYLPCKDAVIWWDLIVEKGKNFNMQFAGLGARDILRVEAGYPLYGHEIDEQTDPLTASLEWAVKFNKNFIGKEALLKLKERGIFKKRVGFVMIDRAIPRTGYNVYSREIKSALREKAAGIVNSGVYSPNLDKFIGMAYIDKSFADIDTAVDIQIRNKFYKAKITKFPFVGIRTYKK